MNKIKKWDWSEWDDDPEPVGRDWGKNYQCTKRTISSFGCIEHLKQLKIVDQIFLLETTYIRNYLNLYIWVYKYECCSYISRFVIKNYKILINIALFLKIISIEINTFLHSLKPVFEALFPHQLKHLQNMFF